MAYLSPLDIEKAQKIQEDSHTSINAILLSSIQGQHDLQQLLQLVKVHMNGRSK